MDNLDYIPGDDHPLLDPATPAYSNVTVRRALIVWMCCGQTNQFRDVCNYYHYLEAMEEKLPPKQRVLSRRHELYLIGNNPPVSHFLLDQFPTLYSQYQKLNNLPKTIKEITYDTVIKMEETRKRDMILQSGTTTEEILAASQMIRHHCRSHRISLKNFVSAYEKYSEKCKLKYTVYNVASYIKRTMIHDELTLLSNMPINFSFLDSSDDESKEKVVTKKNTKNVSNGYYEYLADKENVIIGKTLNGKRKISKSNEGLVTIETVPKPFSVKNNNSNIKILKSKSDITYFHLNEDLKKLMIDKHNNTMSTSRCNP